MASRRNSALGPAAATLLLLLIGALLPGIKSFSELSLVKEPQDVTIGRKEGVVLDCLARGEAPVTITWLKNGVKVYENERIFSLSNGSLYISELESRREALDEGFYQCLALNKYGAVLSQKAHLMVARKINKRAVLYFGLLPGSYFSRLFKWIHTC